MQDAGWTSLEIVKLAVSVMTPIAVVVIGLFVARATARIEHAQWAGQRVVEYRLKVFERIAPKLNRLHCFYTFVGSWKEIDPASVLRLKRELDEDVHVNRALFSPETFDVYQSYMELLFEMYGAPDRDAPIRAFVKTSLGDRRLLPWWKPEMEAKFAQRDIPSLEDVAQAYRRLGDQLRSELFVEPAGRRKTVG